MRFFTTEGPVRPATNPDSQGVDELPDTTSGLIGIDTQCT